LPIRRPCMSVKATTTVSIDPSLTAALNSSGFSTERESKARILDSVRATASK
jgi:hypothetical protein